MLRQSWSQALLSFDGRINRARYWLLPLAPFVPALAAAILAVLIFGDPRASWPVLYPAILVSAVAGVACTVKRLHDRNKSGHWAWLYLGGPFLTAAIDNATGHTDDFTVFTAIGAALVLWMVVDLGFLPGTEGANDYGPNPLVLPEVATTTESET
ncbi:MAG: DUF805 domain-containing protein [Hyphomicrobiaceae bacterium]